MTNKKLKMAAMSVALTACVAASPLAANADAPELSLIHISEPTRLLSISYAVFCL